jgi:hypothetical protein
VSLLVCTLPIVYCKLVDSMEHHQDSHALSASVSFREAELDNQMGKASPSWLCQLWLEFVHLVCGSLRAPNREKNLGFASPVLGGCLSGRKLMFLASLRKRDGSSRGPRVFHRAVFAAAATALPCLPLPPAAAAAEPR